MKNPAVISKVFADITRANSDDEKIKWFEKALDFTVDTFDSAEFASNFAAAVRKLGVAPVKVSETDRKALKDAGSPIAPTGWECAEVARAALMTTAMNRLPDNGHMSLIQDLFYRGDNLERQAVLRSLILFPEPQRFLQIGVDAVRSHVQTVFEAIATDNLFPAAYFDDMQFNQMVLKALFTGASLSRIVGWKQRNNKELVRMASDYAAERKAASRSVPEDIQTIIDQFQE